MPLLSRCLEKLSDWSTIRGSWWRNRSRLWMAALVTGACGLVAAAVLVNLGHDKPVAGPVTQDRAQQAHSIRLVPAAVTTPPPLPRDGWTATADSQETATGNYAAANVLDGDPASFWQTALAGKSSLPHTLTIDMHTTQRVSGLTYLPRPAASSDGRVGRYRVDVSVDGTTWTTSVATGTFADDATLKTITFATVAVRYVRLTALSEAGDRGPWTGAAEINLLAGTDPVLPRTGWTVRADSQDTGSGNHSAAMVLDGSTDTTWRTASTGGGAALPHTLTLDMGRNNLVSGLSYLGRQDGKRDGNIGQFRIETSADGTRWNTAATARFADTNNAQTVAFSPALSRYVRLTALTEAGNRGPLTSVAEINLLGWPDPTAAADSSATRDQTDKVTADPQRHTVTVDMGTSKPVSGVTYQPASAPAGGGDASYQVDVSTDGITWKGVATGTASTAAVQTVTFPTTISRYVRITGHLLFPPVPNPRGHIPVVTPLWPLVNGAWSPSIGFPLVPVAAVLLPNGKVLTWSSYLPDNYLGTGKTVTATYDPATGVVTQRTVTETGHDMFCPGIAILPDGRVLVAGGDDSDKTSIYDPATDAWTTGPLMNIPRGYQSDVTLSDGRVFTIGGSWSGGLGGKNGEVWSAQGGWQLLPGAPVAPILTNDPRGVFRQDNHAWLFAWSGGRVLQAGPSKAMNWFDTTGTGSTTPAGLRGQDGDAMTGDAVMYDAGKILTVGGSPAYENSEATRNANVITITGSAVSVRQVASMTYPRSYANSVVLPDGKVIVFGGENYAVPFSDNTAVLTPEMWDPNTERFTVLPSSLVPRTYHSVAVLLPDGRVFTGGGGLCGSCSTNHFDGQVFTPPNLLLRDGTPAPRPTITTAPATAANGATITVATDRPVTGFSIVRFGAATHTVDTDQRRIALAPTTVAGGYSLTIPADPGIAVPGYYMLFALDAQGVPSVAKIVKIG